MIGIVLAGGNGTRLYPATELVSKHLLTIAGKPMIYYSITTLIYLGCTKIIIVSTKKDQPYYKRLLKSLSKINIELLFVEQDAPKGIPDAIYNTRNLRSNKPAVVILGDNIFVGHDFKSINLTKHPDNFGIITKKVNNPEDFGIIFKNGEGYKFEEKPKEFKGNDAILGLYHIPSDVDSKILNQNFSKRGELEVLDTISKYNEENRLNLCSIGRAVYWCDAGKFDRINEADKFISVLENNSIGLIGSPEEAAYNSNLIDLKTFKFVVEQMPSCAYRSKLEKYLSVI